MTTRDPWPVSKHNVPSIPPPAARAANVYASAAARFLAVAALAGVDISKSND